MKKLYRILLMTLLILVSGVLHAQSSCGAGYSQAQINWDNLDYYYNSGVNTAPYGFSTGNFVTNVMEQSHTFVLGTTDATFALSAAGIAKGTNGTQTSDITNYTGDDAQFTPTGNGQSLTITFGVEVLNASFTLYDVDNLANFAFSAKNAANVAQTMTAATPGGTVLTVVGSGTTVMTVSTLNTTNQSNNSNAGTVTITVAGPVKSITITFTTIGGDPTFWFSDLLACTPGSFPINWQQTVGTQPFAGQPDYFIVTPDNNSVYMLDPLTGKAYWLFNEVIAGQPYVNSFGYDPVSHKLYYVGDGTGTPSNNKALKVYDFNTDTKSTVLADITTALNIPTFDQGVESAAAAFYNGNLYLGIEGGRFNSSNTRQTIIYKLKLNAAGVPTSASQVFATPAYNGGNSAHDWGDFIVKDGKVIDFNTARNGGGPYTYPNSSYIHYDMLMDNVTNNYVNGAPSTPYTGQGGITWAGDVYTVRNVVEKYNMAGGVSGTQTISVVRGPAWVGNAGDGSEGFRPKVDFGDAPSTYDPNPNSPAVHEMDSAIRLGTGFDREWLTNGQTALANSDNFDDALAYTATYNPNMNNYLVQISVFNNTGSNASLCAWLDYNGNGVFDPSEGISQSIPTSATNQSVWLYWNGIPKILANGTYTYLRIRIARGAEGMTTANPTGYYRSGEVEDYRVPVNSFALAVEQFDLDAQITNAKTTKLTWSATDETEVVSYVVERSKNSTDWNMVAGAEAKTSNGVSNYEALDNSPFAGTTYYRLKILRKDGTVRLSNVKKVENNPSRFAVTVAPNPATTKSFVYISSNYETATPATVEIINAQGAVINSEKIKVVKGTNAVALPVAEKLASGRYIIRVTTEYGSNTQTLIVNK